MTIQVVVTTYVPEEGHIRGKYLWEAVRSLQDNLRGGEPIEFILAHDGPDDQADVIKAGCDTLDWTKTYWCVTGGDRVGIGGSLNRALRRVAPDDLWLYTTDDWMLTDRYDLTQAVKLIRHQGYSYVRLGPPHPDVMCMTKFRQGLGWWLDLRPDNGHFMFATRPFVASKRFYEQVGFFHEKCDAYVCELDYSARVIDEWYNSTVTAAEVVNGSLEGPWKHIGEVSVGDKWP